MVDVVTRTVAEEGGVGEEEEEEQVVKGGRAARIRDGEAREDRQGFVG